MTATESTSSPFNDVLDTNHTPSESEIPIVEALIGERQVVVDKIDQEIQEVEKTLNALKKRRDGHTHYIQRHKAFLSPMKRLPIDILSSIFLACRWAFKVTQRHHESEPKTSNMTRDHPAVALSHVCSRWRRICLTTPLLWATIELYPPVYPCIDPYAIHPSEVQQIEAECIQEWEVRIARLKDAFGVWIARSADCPLSVDFIAQEAYGQPFEDQIDVTSSKDSQKHFADFVSILCGVSARWKCVKFHLTISGPSTPLLRLLLLPPDRVPLLEELDFGVFFSPAREPDAVRVLEECEQGLMRKTGLFKAPNLRVLTLSLLWEPIMSTPVDWSALTEFTFCGYNLQHVYSAPTPSNQFHFGCKEALVLLKACPRLVKCTLALEYPYDDTLPLGMEDIQASIDTTITLPHLHTLNLRGSSAIPCGFAPSLCLPSLRSLSIVGNTDRPRGEHDSGTVECVRAFGEKLEFFVVNYTSLTPEALQCCLENLPEVVELSFTSQHMDYEGIIGPDGTPGPDAEPMETPAQFTAELLGMLTPKFDGEGNLVERCLCPKLERFRCRLISPTFMERDLVGFIEARRSRHTASTGYVVRLRSVDVDFPSPQKMDVQEELEERGVDMEDLSVKTKNPQRTLPMSHVYSPFPLPFELLYGDVL